jgi:hypothetical protein
MTCVLSLKTGGEAKTGDREPVYIIIDERAVRVVVANRGGKMLLEERYYDPQTGVGEKVPRTAQRTKFVRAKLMGAARSLQTKD